MALQFHLYQGRLNRTGLALGALYYFMIGTLCIAILLSILLSTFDLTQTDHSWRASALFLELCFVACFYGLYVRRLHDLGRPNWQIIYALIPIINIAFLLYLLIAKGEPGTNQYGPPVRSLSTLQILGFSARTKESA